MMIPVSDRNSAKAPTPSMIVWMGPAPGRALKLGVMCRFSFAASSCACACIARPPCVPCSRSRQEPISDGGRHPEVGMPRGWAKATNVGLRSSREVGVPRHLHDRAAAPSEMFLYSVDFDKQVFLDAVHDRDSAADELGVPVLVQPVERGAGGPRRVEARRHHHHDLVG